MNAIEQKINLDECEKKIENDIIERNVAGKSKMERTHWNELN